MKKLLKKKVNVFGKGIPLFAIVLLSFALVSAALLTYFGQAIITVNVEQGLYLDGNAWNVPTVREASITSLGGIVSSAHYLENKADVDAEVGLNTVCSANVSPNSCYEILLGTSYWKEVKYAYSQTWTANGDVNVTVEDTNDGWLQWTYTAVDPVTSGKLKMTVEIDNPTGFGITTFDDGSHDGWYYYNAGGVVRISDYDGANKIAGYDFVETSVFTDGMRVRIKKTELPNTFKWQGFANFHLAQNWIELNTGGSPWVPTGVGVIRETLTSPFTVPAGETLDFVIVSNFPAGTYPGTYTLTTSVTV